MATVSVVAPQAKQTVKPSRSMTHPLHDPKAKGSRGRVKKGEPFDPEELSRRLTAHLIEQKAKSERRRAARAAKEAAAQQNQVYHHVPTVAAVAFERTTTPDVLRQVHKLSQPAIRQHLEVLSLDDPNHHTLTALQQKKALDQAMIDRERLRNRNQFQWTHGMEEAAEADIERDVFKPPTRTFAEFAYLRSRHEGTSTQRPLSTGDVFSEDEERRIAPLAAKLKPKLKYDGRNDWAQEDENDKRTLKEKASPFIAKKDSIWGLKGKKEKPSIPDKDEAVVGIGDLVSPPKPGHKTRKNSFLARFTMKRQPS